jgi:hypothetical protein
VKVFVRTVTSHQLDRRLRSALPQRRIFRPVDLAGIGRSALLSKALAMV